MDTQQVMILGTQYTVPAPYSAGHVLNTAEAAAMNQLLAENLRNNFSARIHKVKAGERSLDQSDLDKYAATYAFGLRVAGAHVSRVDPVMAEARKLVGFAVRAALKRKGTSLKALKDGQMNKLISDALERNPKFIDRAREIVRDRQAIVEELSAPE